MAIDWTVQIGDLIAIIAGILMFGGVLAKMLSDNRDMNTRMMGLQDLWNEKHNKLEQKVEQTDSRLESMMKEIRASLGKIYDRLDGKADKGGH